MRNIEDIWGIEDHTQRRTIKHCILFLEISDGILNVLQHVFSLSVGTVGQLCSLNLWCYRLSHTAAEQVQMSPVIDFSDAALMMTKHFHLLSLKHSISCSFIYWFLTRLDATSDKRYLFYVNPIFILTSLDSDKWLATLYFINQFYLIPAVSHQVAPRRISLNQILALQCTVNNETNIRAERLIVEF